MQEQGFWLSPQQKFIWTLEQEVLRVPSRAVCLVSLDGAFEQDRLRNSLRTLVNRHEILRTVFRRQTGMKVPFQVVRESSDVGWEHDDLSPLAPQECESQILELLRKEQSAGATSETAPALNARLITIVPDHSRLIISVPSLCADTGSLQVLVSELGNIYAGRQDSLPESFRYVQFAQWQGDLLESEEEDARKGKDFWAERKFAAIEAALPPEKKADDRFQPEVHTVSAGSDLSAKIVASSNSSAILLSAWETLLARLSSPIAFPIGFQ